MKNDEKLQFSLFILHYDKHATGQMMPRAFFTWDNDGLMQPLHLLPKDKHASQG